MALSGNFRLAPQLRPAESARAHGWPCTCYEKFVDSPAWGVFVAQSINSRNVSRHFYPSLLDLEFILQAEFDEIELRKAVLAFLCRRLSR